MQAVLAALTGLFVVFTAQWSNAAAPAPSVLAQAIAAAQAQDWDKADQFARLQDGLAGDLVLWHKLRAGEGTTQQALDFLRRHPDWPGLPYLRAQSEAALLDPAPDQVIAFFDRALPQRAEGALALCRAMTKTGRTDVSQTVAMLAWRTMPMDADLQAQMLNDCGTGLNAAHELRLDAALWAGWRETAQAMLPLVSADWQALAKARMALHYGENGVDDLIRAVPPALSGHAGLAYERMLWRLRKGRMDGAADIMRSSSTSSAALGRAEHWARARLRLVREMMDLGNWQAAYDLAHSHYLPDGDDYAELEWLSGFLALRKLNDPKTALAHFERLEAAVTSPISLGRAGYWRGRAYDAMGQAAQAKAAYSAGAQHQTSFYGQLAAQAAGIAPDPALAGAGPDPVWAGAAFTQTHVFRAAAQLYAAGEHDLAERFFTHIAEDLPQADLPAFGAYLAQKTDPHIQVTFGKRAAARGVVLPRYYFPMHPVANLNHPVPTELVLAISRRESEFNPAVQSSAGARGLMQLLPSTAKRMARDVGVAFTETQLDDWQYNARLGAAYLADLSGQFDGNLVMIAAGYNAGPNRPRDWMKRLGDPRTGQVDILDWIEQIPYRETRNYVMRVAESVNIYRSRRGQAWPKDGFKAELAGGSMR